MNSTCRKEKNKTNITSYIYIYNQLRHLSNFSLATKKVNIVAFKSSPGLSETFIFLSFYCCNVLKSFFLSPWILESVSFNICLNGKTENLHPIPKMVSGVLRGLIKSFTASTRPFSSRRACSLMSHSSPEAR